MGTQDRRQRELAAREQRFLDAAQALIQRDGLLNLQMARIAEACDYATGTLYQHFASKEDLLVALATRNCLCRLDLFERAARWSGPTRDRMLAIAIADVLTLRAQPEHFRLNQFVWNDVVWGAASAPARARALAASAPLSALIEGIAGEAIRVGDLPADSPSPRTLTIGAWALSQGMHTLAQVDGLLDGYDLDGAYRVLFRHLNCLLDGYRWQPLLGAVDAAALDALFERLCHDVFGTSCASTSAAATD